MNCKIAIGDSVHVKKNNKTGVVLGVFPSQAIVRFITGQYIWYSIDELEVINNFD
jgi:hypothetical protein